MTYSYYRVKFMINYTSKQYVKNIISEVNKSNFKIYEKGIISN